MKVQVPYSQKNEDQKKNMKDAVVRCRRNKKNKLIEYKGGKCIKCGYNKSSRSLEFHHLDPSLKDFSIANNLSLERCKKEVDKCILVCSNCHGEIHEELYLLTTKKTLNNNSEFSY